MWLEDTDRQQSAENELYQSTMYRHRSRIWRAGECLSFCRRRRLARLTREWSNQRESSAYTNPIDDLSNILSFLHCPSLIQYRSRFSFKPSQANLGFCSCRPTISSTSANFYSYVFHVYAISAAFTIFLRMNMKTWPSLFNAAK